MLGDVWEWTASDFTAYPGFATFPYKEYSEVFYGSDYKVLRGGSWATSPLVARATFRNWDYPIRRQIFAGFRCARMIVLSPSIELTVGLGPDDLRGRMRADVARGLQATPKELPSK